MRKNSYVFNMNEPIPMHDFFISDIPRLKMDVRSKTRKYALPKTVILENKRDLKISAPKNCVSLK